MYYLQYLTKFISRCYLEMIKVYLKMIKDEMFNKKNIENF